MNALVQEVQDEDLVRVISDDELVLVRMGTKWEAILECGKDPSHFLRGQGK